jgi:hypothetical protein
METVFLSHAKVFTETVRDRGNEPPRPSGKSRNARFYIHFSEFFGILRHSHFYRKEAGHRTYNKNFQRRFIYERFKGFYRTGGKRRGTQKDKSAG